MPPAVLQCIGKRTLHRSRSTLNRSEYRRRPYDMEHYTTAAAFGMETTILWQNYRSMGPVQGITASQDNIKGIVFYSRVMILIWRVVVEQWTLCNSHLHPSSTTMDDCTQLAYIVHQIIQEAQNDPELQDLVSAFDREVLLRKSIKHIRHWITNSKNHMLAHQKAATIRAQIRTKDIRTYFPVMHSSTEPSTNEKNLLRPP